MHDLQYRAQFGLYFGEKLSYAECCMVFPDLHDFTFYSTRQFCRFFFFSSFSSPSLLRGETFSCKNRARFFPLSLLICGATLQNPESAAWFCLDAADTFLHGRLHCTVGNRGILLRTPLTPHPKFSAFRLDCRMSICLGQASSLQAHQSTAMPRNRVDWDWAIGAMSYTELELYFSRAFLTGLEQVCPLTCLEDSRHRFDQKCRFFRI